ncbi:hypothetical protein TNCV_1914641 [Trichonephila clavipes]|nr:hypothetical protein TNCV_1914641 [Trichonephila clavipes]
MNKEANEMNDRTHGEINYDAKLVFSDDEESPNQKKDKTDIEDKPSKSHSNLKTEKERDRKLERERDAPNRESRSSCDPDWSHDNRPEKKSDHESDWTFERGDGFDRERHGNYPPPRAARPSQRSSFVADDDEIWRQRRKQYTEEMTTRQK